MADSPHAAGWINLLQGTGWDIYLFSAYITTRTHRYWQLTPNLGLSPGRNGGGVKLLSLAPHQQASAGLEWCMNRLPGGPAWRSRWLAWAIKRLKPDIVHSLELQKAGALTLEARRHLGGDFPTWAISNYGSDVYLFSRLKETKPRVLEMLKNADQYVAECERDIGLARELGYRGGVMPVMPNCGGFDLPRMKSFRQEGPVSRRKVIAIKGYQNWAGRALTALKAVELCAEHLSDYRIILYLTSPDVELAAELLALDSGLDIQCLPSRSPSEDVWRMHGSARISIGVSISDAASTSMLEAMAMGSFPIQTCTACADEWIEDGVSGFIVPPDDPQFLAKKLRQAVSDDALVDRADIINTRTVDERLDRKELGRSLIEAYKEILTDKN